MDEGFQERRLSRKHQEQHAAGQKRIQAIFPQLKPSEQGLARLLYGLDGAKVHSREQILEKYPDASRADLDFLDDKIERMVKIYQRGAKDAPPGFVNVPQPKRKKDLVEDIDEGVLEDLDEDNDYYD